MLYFVCEDCSAAKLEYWGGEYLELVWNMTGTADCCYEEACNDNRNNPDRFLSGKQIGLLLPIIVVQSLP